MPPITGDTTAQAQSAIAAAGLVAHVNTRSVTDPSKVGRVVTQSPPGGSQLTKGSTVTIMVGIASSSSSSSPALSSSTSLLVVDLDLQVVETTPGALKFGRLRCRARSR